MSFPEALAAVRARIAAAGADPDAVRIVAVTKGQGPDAVRAALAAGHRDLGENYAQELLAKAAQLGVPPDPAAGPCWHFLGAVQRNKVRSLAPLVHLWQGVDRSEEGERIAAVAPGSAVLVQVCLAPGPGRAGCAPADVAGLVGRLAAQGNRVLGLMAVGPPGDPEESRPGFRWLAAEARRLGLPEVSMGMSDDLEVAVQEGATLVRVGRALFGPRPGAASLGR